MNYYFTGVLIILMFLLTLLEPAYPDSTQTNVIQEVILQSRVDILQLQLLTMLQAVHLILHQTLLIILILNQHHQQLLHHHSLLNHKTFVQQEYQ
jgi:Leucine-rich repeat (LRR) protein